ncbi:MAG: hypothetical protein EZS28_000454 [Streblomastix strix]|uniref:Uncharacterized protein n=1 Tax=Streblomastix strix TaxID=222440 RepID=A0A5J4XA73_9EUKA|nr:MAG: hypothetical protein EZS28_000454 [Streblomastix strix]
MQLHFLIKLTLSLLPVNEVTIDEDYDEDVDQGGSAYLFYLALIYSNKLADDYFSDQPGGKNFFLDASLALDISAYSFIIDYSFMEADYGLDVLNPFYDPDSDEIVLFLLIMMMKNGEIVLQIPNVILEEGEEEEEEDNVYYEDGLDDIQLMKIEEFLFLILNQEILDVLKMDLI